MLFLELRLQKDSIINWKFGYIVFLMSKSVVGGGISLYYKWNISNCSSNSQTLSLSLSLSLYVDDSNYIPFIFLVCLVLIFLVRLNCIPCYYYFVEYD